LGECDYAGTGTTVRVSASHSKDIVPAPLAWPAFKEAKNPTGILAPPPETEEVDTLF